MNLRQQGLKSLRIGSRSLRTSHETDAQKEAEEFHGLQFNSSESYLRIQFGHPEKCIQNSLSGLRPTAGGGSEEAGGVGS